MSACSACTNIYLRNAEEHAKSGITTQQLFPPDQLVKEVQFWYPHQPTYAHLEEAARNECQICSILLVRFKSEYLGLSLKEAFNISASPTITTGYDYVECNQVDARSEQDFVHGADSSTALKEGLLPARKMYRLQKKSFPSAKQVPPAQWGIPGEPFLC